MPDVNLLHIQTENNAVFIELRVVTWARESKLNLKFVQESVTWSHVSSCRSSTPQEIPARNDLIGKEVATVSCE